MTRVLFGDHIGRQGRLRLGCSAMIFSENRSRILLTRRSDNGMWCLPGGMVEAGESVSEACEREVREETGLTVRVTHLSGIYSDPNCVVVYPDGNQAHIIVLNFEVEWLGGEPIISHETTAISWFSSDEAVKMDLFHNHANQIRDALAGQEAAFIR